MTGVLDYLDPGSNYTLEYYYSMNSGFNGWYYDDFTFNGSEEIGFSISVTDWDCSIQVYEVRIPVQHYEWKLQLRLQRKLVLLQSGMLQRDDGRL